MKDTIRFEKGNVKMIAHRGLSGIERENTCAAFIAAGNRDYYGIETDIRPTADGKFIIIHEGHTGDVSEVVVNVEEQNFDDLRAIPVLDKDGVVRPYLGLPTLEEYVAICAKYGKVGVLELKGYFSKEMLGEILAVIREMYSMESMTFISFNYDSIVNLRELEPTASIQFLTGGCEVDDALVAKLKAYNFDLDIQHASLTEEAVKLLHANGIVINCWTVDSPTRAAELASWGVDQITSNILQ